LFLLNANHVEVQIILQLQTASNSHLREESGLIGNQLGVQRGRSALLQQASLLALNYALEIGTQALQYVLNLRSVLVVKFDGELADLLLGQSASTAKTALNDL
jgi:hypothetical protein